MKPTEFLIYAFDSFKLDLRRGALLDVAGKEIPLRAKSFILLQLLVENAGVLLSHDLIMETLWPGVFVTENNLTQCISEIRAALGAEARGILRTVARRGYVFTAEVVATTCRDAGCVKSTDETASERSNGLLDIALMPEILQDQTMLPAEPMRY